MFIDDGEFEEGEEGGVEEGGDKTGSMIFHEKDLELKVRFFFCFLFFLVNFFFFSKHKNAQTENGNIRHSKPHYQTISCW